MIKQNEIREKGPLLDDKGILTQIGWSRHHYLKYEREKIRAPWYRIKEWDYYAILSPDYGITLTMADLGLMGVYNVTFLDFKKRTFHTVEDSKLFTKGKTGLASSPEEDYEAIFRSKKLELVFSKSGNKRKLDFYAPDFMRKELKGTIVLEQPEMDYLTITIPWQNKPYCFYYNTKINCMPANGEVRIGEKTYYFRKEESFGVLDWGRGNWPYRNTWYWSSASGKQQDHIIGFNLGYGFGDTSKATENIFYLDGVGHKLEEVEFRYNPKNYLEPWRIISQDKRIDLTMRPIVDRNSKVNLLIFKSVQHQVFGTFSGKVVLDNGDEFIINSLIGFAEKVYNRW